jgi:hypothetical protein
MDSPNLATFGDTQSKYDSDYIEEKGTGADVSDPAALLSESHKLYLIERHGTLDLDPIPSMDPADPYNWPSWKVGENGIVFRILG